MEWALEVRSDYNEGNNQRLGELTIRGTMEGLLTLRITEETVA